MREGLGAVGSKVVETPDEQREREMMELEAKGEAILMWHEGKGFRYQLTEKNGIERAKRWGYLMTKLNPSTGEYNIVRESGESQKAPSTKPEPANVSRASAKSKAREQNKDAFGDA